MRKIKDTDLIGKTIKQIKNTSVNVLELIFSDDSKLELWAESTINTQFGSVPGIFVEDKINA